jgi:hypothetical protein
MTGLSVIKFLTWLSSAADTHFCTGTDNNGVSPCSGHSRPFSTFLSHSPKNTKKVRTKVISSVDHQIVTAVDLAKIRE